MNMNSCLAWLKKSLALCENIYELPNDTTEGAFFDLESDYATMSEDDHEYILTTLKDICDNNIDDLLYILSIYMRFMKRSEFLDIAYDMVTNANMDCFKSAMLEYQLKVLSGKMPQSYYIRQKKLHNKNVRSFKEHLDINFPYHPLKARNKKHIVIVTEQIISEHHSPTKIVLTWSYVLQNIMGYEVLLFSCPCNRKLEGWFSPISSNHYSGGTVIDYSIPFMDTDINFFQVSMYADCKEAYIAMLDTIYTFNPICVLALGCINPLADIPQTFTTLVSMDMVVGIPVSSANILLNIGKTDISMYPIDSHQKIVDIDLKLTYFKADKDSYERADYNLPQNKFLIAIVGNRLDSEIDNEFITTMKQIVLLNQNISYVLFGDVQSLKQQLECNELHGHIHYMGYSKDLQGMYSMMDLYVNPNRSGGGFSGLMAAVAGVPVVTFPDCDVAYNVGSDFVIKDYNEMIDIVIRYSYDTTFYKQKQRCTQCFAKANTKEAMLEQQEKTLHTIIDCVSNLTETDNL